MPDVHRYPERAIYADYLRAAGGLAITLGPLLLLEVIPALGVVLGLLGALFGWFLLRTWIRHRSTLTVSVHGIELHGPSPRRISWQELAQLKLAYFAPRGNRERGWFELKLQSTRGARLRIDSTVDDFEALLARVVAAARAQHVVLDETTLANLNALGLSIERGMRDDPAA